MGRTITTLRFSLFYVCVCVFNSWVRWRPFLLRPKIDLSVSPLIMDGCGVLVKR
jgi:hypothetical protein